MTGYVYPVAHAGIPRHRAWVQEIGGSTVYLLGVPLSKLPKKAMRKSSEKKVQKKSCECLRLSVSLGVAVPYFERDF